MAEVANIAEAMGCQYWVRRSTIMFWVKGKWERTVPAGYKSEKKHKGRAGIQCHKMVREDWEYCPHHIAIMNHEAGRFKRAGEASARSRAHKAKMEEVLKHSPLAAVNPNYKGKHDGL